MEEKDKELGWEKSQIMKKRKGIRNKEGRNKRT